MSTTEPPSLKHLPIGLFASVMGLAGLALAWRRAESVAWLPSGSWWLPGALAAVAFVLIGGAAILRASRFPDAAIGDWRHPVKLNFFAAISIALILFGTLLARPLPALALPLWAIGAVAHLALTLVALRRWILAPSLPLAALNPAWFIPVVGNILVPLAGVEFGYLEPSWFFFSVGIFFWPILLALILYRLFFHEPLPQRLAPTIFILLAPPAVGFLAYLRLTDSFDAFARVLFYVMLLTLLLLATKLPHFARLPFFPSSWAYSFPLAAATVASFEFAQRLGSPLALALAGALAAAATLVIAALVVLTLRAAFSGALLAAEG
jgi:tellurite resistance protein